MLVHIAYNINPSRGVYPLDSLERESCLASLGTNAIAELLPATFAFTVILSKSSGTLTMDGRRSHPQKKPRVEYNAMPLENQSGKEFGDLNHQQVDDPLLRQRAKQACDKCRAKKCAVSTFPNRRLNQRFLQTSAPEEISSYPVTNAKDPVGCAISPNRRFHSRTALCHCGIQ
jgi:hypothetical protein